MTSGAGDQQLEYRTDAGRVNDSSVTLLVICAPKATCRRIDSTATGALCRIPAIRQDLAASLDGSGRDSHMQRARASCFAGVEGR